MHTRTILVGIWSLAVVGTMAACGGGGSPTAPGGDGGSGGSGAPGPVGATITITASGSNSVTINSGQSVTFVNNDSRTRNVSSNPHPVHTDCAALNIGPVSPGQSRTTNTFTTARACGFHDHDDPDNRNVQGTVTVR